MQIWLVEALCKRISISKKYITKYRSEVISCERTYRTFIETISKPIIDIISDLDMSI